MPKYHSQTAQFIATVVQNIPEVSGEMMQRWIEDPLGLQRALETLCIKPKPKPKFEAWRTIKLGIGPKTGDDFRSVLRDGILKLSDWASDVLGQPAFTVATDEIEVNLAKVSVAELGFEQGARRDQIFESAKEFGLELCPPEVGPQLRLQYKDYPNNEWLLVGMEPIIASSGHPYVFSVECDDSGLWLSNAYGSPHYFWTAEGQWIFVSPRK